MTDTRLAILDNGAVNDRILARERNRADFRRVEAAGLKYRTQLHSPDAKRVFARCMESFQLNTYFIGTHGRIKLPPDIVEAVETEVRTRLGAATDRLNRSIDEAENKFKSHGISRPATYDTVALEVEVAIISSLGRRYFELLHKLDLLMPLLQTLEIEEVMSAHDVDHARSEAKRVVIGVASTTRKLANGVRRRLNEADAAREVATARPQRSTAREEEGDQTTAAATAELPSDSTPSETVPSTEDTAVSSEAAPLDEVSAAA